MTPKQKVIYDNGFAEGYRVATENQRVQYEAKLNTERQALARKAMEAKIEALQAMTQAMVSMSGVVREMR